ncbi:MAG: tetratricopeptide repeat protein [bacterium]|nr:tetratricopeptide repeat protein [bacterium]
MFNFFSKKEVWLPIAVLVVVGGFVYSFNLNNQLFWDDNDWIINNNFVHTISLGNIKFWLTHNTLGGVGLKSNYYRPFLFFTFALNYMVAGIKPLAYHLTSNFIHIINGILVFFLLKRFDLGISKGRTLAVAFLTSLIFLIHPLQTEAITYISGRGDALVTFFMLLALYLWTNDTACRYGKTVDNSPQRHGVSLRILSLISLVLALLSRETGIIFPFLALALYVSFMSKDRFVKSIKQGLIATWPYFAVVLVYGILRLTVLNFQNTLNFYTEPNIYSENLYVRLFTFLPILWEYLKLLIVPTGLHMERSATVYTSLFQWPVWLIFFGLVCLLAYLRHLYKKQSTVFRVWFLGTALFFIPLGPVSGITPINALIYEHWLYLPIIGFWFIVSFYLVKLFAFFPRSIASGKKSKASVVGRGSLVICLIIYLSFFAYQSVQRNLLWGNQLDFYLDILKYEPDSSRINNNVGNIYYNKKDLENAEKYYIIAASQEDIFAEPHFNLGTILQSRGDIYGAIKEYEKAIEINPDFFYPYQNLAVIYAQQGDFTKAIENIEKLKLFLPNNPRVYYNSALVYIAINDKEKALEDVKTGLKYVNQDPEMGELLEELAGQLSK